MDRKESSEPKQRTPKGLEIPVPKRRDLMDAFKKLIQPAKKAQAAQQTAASSSSENIALASSS